MKHETTQGLYRYWNTVRGNRLAPRRYEIEPSQIIPYLADTLILEKLDEDDCRVRVAGTRVGEVLGINLRGQTFSELWSAKDQIVLRDNIRTIMEHGSAGFFTFSGDLASDQPSAEFELLLLPLTHLGDRIDRMLGCITLANSPDWLSAAPPASFELLSNELIWPDGRPRGSAKLNKEPPMFAPREVPSLRPDGGVRRARLVRSERRSFLVYDGGLSEQDAAKDAKC